ncbi:MAG: hypothetical protein V9E98_11980 [Candidatus Nanopelagicales bacterium]
MVVAVIMSIVSVPVLSLLMALVQPRVSTSVRLRTTALARASRCAPPASIVVRKVGSPAGIDEIATVMANRTIWSVGRPADHRDDHDDGDRDPREDRQPDGHARDLALQRGLVGLDVTEQTGDLAHLGVRAGRGHDDRWRCRG